MIVWKYIDTPGAAVAAIRDYNDMREIINITPQEIKDLHEGMVSPRSSRISGLPLARNPQAGEEKLVKSLDKLDVLQERYRQAVEYMSWFEPAWASLTDTEQRVLREFYMGGSLRSGASARLEQELCYSEAQVERLRRRSLSRLSLLLFGK